MPDKPNVHSLGLYYLLEKRGGHIFSTKSGFELLFPALIQLVRYLLIAQILVLTFCSKYILSK